MNETSSKWMRKYSSASLYTDILALQYNSKNCSDFIANFFCYMSPNLHISYCIGEHAEYLYA